MSKIIPTVCGAFLVMGLGVVIVQQHRENVQLRADLENLQQQGKQASATSLAPVVVSNPKPKPTPDNSLELLRLRGQIGVMNQELSTLRSNRAILKAISKMLQNPLNLDQFPDSHDLVKLSTATNVGTATPAAMVQTSLWAQRIGDVEGCISTTDWPEGTSDEAKTNKVNQEYADDEETKKNPNIEPMEGYRLLAIWPVDDNLYFASVRVYNRYNTAECVTGMFFRKTEDGWKMTTEVHSALGEYLYHSRGMDLSDLPENAKLSN